MILSRATVEAAKARSFCVCLQPDARVIRTSKGASTRSFMNSANRIGRLSPGTGYRFLRRTKGVIHVGGNEGQERDIYARYKFNVLWIEPLDVLYRKQGRLKDCSPHIEVQTQVLGEKAMTSLRTHTTA
jgi:hypothetical protein